VAERYNPERWCGNYFYAISLGDLIAYKRKANKFEYPEVNFYVIKEGGNLQTSERKNILDLTEFTNKQLRGFFD
ncbi:MAG: hypothetical protein M0P94_04825, partial [Candidatus Absconditabacterales bacterium]|nr:hypothetical protein [Candidatus Absconditabacterales bacterium]